MNTLIILRGLPGAGKTSFLQSQLDIRTGVHAFSADDYFYDENGNYNWNPSKIHLAHQSCYDSTHHAMKSGWLDTIIVHNTFTREKEIKPYQELASIYDWRFVSLIVENRHGSESVHNVPISTIHKMKNRFSVKL